MADSEAGSLISFGAVAVLAILGYKKIQSIFGGSSGSSEGNTAEQAAAKIVSGGSTVKETVKEVIVQSTGSGSESGKFDPLSWYGIFGTDAPDWFKQLTGNTNKVDEIKPAVTQQGISKTYGTGDTEYDKYVDSLTDQWTANIKANQAAAQSAANMSVAQQGIDLFTAGYAAMQSGQESFTVNGSKYTAVVTAPKTGKSSSGSSSIKRQGGSGTGEDKVRIIKKVA